MYILQLEDDSTCHVVCHAVCHYPCRCMHLAELLSLQTCRCTGLFSPGVANSRRQVAPPKCQRVLLCQFTGQPNVREYEWKTLGKYVEKIQNTNE